MDTKTCNTCGETKGTADYGRHKATRDGLRNACKPCETERMKTYYRENKARRLAYRDAYYAANRDRITAKAREVRDPLAERERVAAWRVANPEKEAARVARSGSARRARKARVPHVPYVRADIFAAYSGTCAYCPAPAEHLDHVNPISRGGADAAHNLLPACAPCNLGKGAKSLAEWALSWP